MTTGLSFILTLLIFSYLLGDNLLYRLSVAVFVGLTAAFTVIVTFQSVIFPLLQGTGNELFVNVVILTVAGVLALLLVLRPIHRLRALTNLAVGFLVAVGSAVAVVGAITGTLIPLVQRTVAVDFSAEPATVLNSLLLVLGVMTSLLYFQVIARRRRDGTVTRGRIVELLSHIGQGFIVVTLGAMYAAAILTSLSILTGQLQVIFGG